MACNQNDNLRAKGRIDVPLRPNGEPVMGNSSYDPRYCNQIIALAKIGKSYAEICTALGISKKRSEHWRTIYSEWDEALDIALTAYETHMNEIGYRNLEWTDAKSQPQLRTDVWKELKLTSKSNSEIKEEVKQDSARLKEVIGELLGKADER